MLAVGISKFLATSRKRIDLQIIIKSNQTLGFSSLSFLFSFILYSISPYSSFHFQLLSRSSDKDKNWRFFLISGLARNEGISW